MRWNRSPPVRDALPARRQTASSPLDTWAKIEPSFFSRVVFSASLELVQIGGLVVKEGSPITICPESP